jgi:regulatory protein
MPKLTQVKETKRGRYALFFDGEFAFSLDEDTFAMAGLHTGDELEEWQIHDLQTKSDTRKAVDKAMDLLALPQTVYDLQYTSAAKAAKALPQL